MKDKNHICLSRQEYLAVKFWVLVEKRGKYWISVHYLKQKVHTNTYLTKNLHSLKKQKTPVCYTEFNKREICFLRNFVGKLQGVDNYEARRYGCVFH